MPEKKIMVVPSVEALSAVQTMLEELMDEALVPMKIAMKMNIAVDEIFSNIMYYSEAKEAEIRCCVAEGRIELDFTDDGKPYNPLEAKEPDITLDIEEREAGGLGILITRKLMDEIRYAYADGRNHLHLLKNL